MGVRGPRRRNQERMWRVSRSADGGKREENGAEILMAHQHSDQNGLIDHPRTSARRSLPPASTTPMPFVALSSPMSCRRKGVAPRAESSQDWMGQGMGLTAVSRRRCVIEYSTSALDVLTLRPPDPFPLVSFDHQQTSTHAQLPFDVPKHYKSREPSTASPIPSPHRHRHRPGRPRLRRGGDGDQQVWSARGGVDCGGRVCRHPPLARR